MDRRLALALVALLAGCGGGSSPSAPATAAAPAAAPPAGGVGGRLTLAIPVPPPPAAAARRSSFVSGAASSAGVSLNGGAPSFFDVSATSTMCGTTNAVRTCALPVSAPVGSNQRFAVSLYDAPNGGAPLLGSGSGSVDVVQGAAFTLAIGINPVVASLASLSPQPSFTLGQAAQVVVTPTFADPAGQPIAGGGNVPNFLNPVSLTSSDPHVTVAPTTLAAPGQTVTFSYDGSPAVAAAVSVTATSAGKTVSTTSLNLAGLIAIRDNLGADGTIRPAQLVVGPDGKIWWAEQGTNTIGRLDPTQPVGSGSRIAHFPSGFTSGSPVGIAVGGDGNIWYSNGGQLIARMTTSGAPPASGPVQLTVSAAGGQVDRMTTDSQGNVWYVNAGAGFSQVAYVDASTFAVHTFGSTPTTNAIKSSSAIALGADNNIWFTEPFTAPQAMIGKAIAPVNGTYAVTEIALQGTSASVFPFDIAKGPDGNIWIPVFASNAANQFYAVLHQSSPNSTQVSVYANEFDPNAFANLVTMAAGPDGNMWIAEGGGGLKIPPATPAKPVVELFTDNGQTTMDNCVAGPDGKMYCTAIGSPPLGQGFIATQDSIVSWVPR